MIGHWFAPFITWFPSMAQDHLVLVTFAFSFAYPEANRANVEISFGVHMFVSINWRKI